MSPLYADLVIVPGGNTAGTTKGLGPSGKVMLAGGNNITLSQVGNSVSIVGGAGGAGIASAGMSNIGNTSGTTGLISQQLVLAGGNNITLSQSVDGGSATVTISAGAGGAAAAISGFEPFHLMNPASTTYLPGRGTWYFQPFVAPQPLASGRLNILVAHSASTLFKASAASVASNTTGTRSMSFTMGHYAALYSRGAGANSTRLESFWSNSWSLGISHLVSVILTNATNVRATMSATLSYIASVGSNGAYTTTTVASGTSSSSASVSMATVGLSAGFTSLINMLTGSLFIPIGFNTSIAAGMYWLAQAWLSSSTTGGSAMATVPWPDPIHKVALYGLSSMPFRLFGLTVSNTSSQFWPGAGIYSATSAVPPPTVPFTDIRSVASHVTQYFNHINIPV